MKYRLSPREILRAEPEGFPEGSGDILSYTSTLVTIQSFSITSTSEYFLVFWLEGNIVTAIFQYSIVR